MTGSDGFVRPEREEDCLTVKLSNAFLSTLEKGCCDFRLHNAENRTVAILRITVK